MTEHARVLLVDDNASLREALQILLESQGFEPYAVGSAEEGLAAMVEQSFDLLITDLLMPGLNGLQFIRRLRSQGSEIPVVMMTAYGSQATAEEAKKLGIWRYVAKPFRNQELLHAVRGAIRSSPRAPAEILQAVPARFHELIGASPAMQEVYELIERVRDTRINCLLHGESGTGKERVARAIHYSGSRREQPFVAVNCGAISETLIESELFGYKRGSFTGAARDKDGYFLAAKGGTLFLDEVGEMPLSTQVKVLRALAERRILPVGGTQEISVDVRIIAATNRNLEEEVSAGRFREDLYYRLNVVRVKLPPLRNRGHDVILLAEHFVEMYAREQAKEIQGLSKKASEILISYGWPGNVRELQNAIELAVAMEPGRQISPLSLPRSLQAAASALERGGRRALTPEPAAPPPLPSSRPQTARALFQSQQPAPLRPPPVDVEVPSLTRDELRLPSSLPAEGVDLAEFLNDVERHYLELALKLSGGNKTKAAKLLRMSFRSFRYRCDKLDVH